MEYYTILTDAGRALEAAALAGERAYTLAACALGDGGGRPDPTRTALQNEVWRGAINTIAPDHDNPTWLVIEAHVPPEAGGFTIREFGIYTDDGTLFAIGNYPETYKPKLENGTGIDLIVRPICQVSNAESVTLLIDPAIVMASRKYVDDSIANAASSLLPLVDGLADTGSQPTFARGDHVHPVDTSRAPAVHTHTIVQVSDLQAALNAKEDKILWPQTRITLYIRTDGNDANDGLSYTPAGAFKTLAGAVTGIRNFYCRSGWPITILVGPGTYESVVVQSLPIALTFKSYDLSNKAIVTADKNAFCFHSLYNSFVTINNLILSPLSNEAGGVAGTAMNSVLLCENVTCTSMGTYGFRSISQGTHFVRGTTEIQGGGGYAFETDVGGLISIEGTIKVTGNPQFIHAFCRAGATSHIRAAQCEITGTAIGKRYIVVANSVITAQNQPNLFPGTEAGSVGSGGLYL